MRLVSGLSPDLNDISKMHATDKFIRTESGQEMLRRGDAVIYDSNEVYRPTKTSVTLGPSPEQRMSTEPRVKNDSTKVQNAASCLALFL